LTNQSNTGLSGEYTMSDEAPKDDTEMLTDAQLLSLVAGDRLVYIQLLETFKNDVTNLILGLNNKLSEVNQQIQLRNQALVDGGKAMFVEQEAQADEEE
tara:strand:+ start:1116 stop:1412 length:297 start_codon:yes stop_codon:yes gene_type:complete